MIPSKIATCEMKPLKNIVKKIVAKSVKSATKKNLISYFPAAVIVASLAAVPASESPMSMTIGPTTIGGKALSIQS